METGIIWTSYLTVTEDKTAAALGNGGFRVFATPELISLIESTARDCVAPYLESGMGTVGTHIDIRHLAATPIGMNVCCETKLCEIDRRRLVFDVIVRDECEIIADGRHERFIVRKESFMQKAAQKSKIK